MEKKNTFSKDLIMVLFSNLIILVSSIVTGFIVPKLLGVKEYGYYKIFTLYLSYSALAHLGYVDGILLKFAGKDYKELPKEKFRQYTKFFFMFQCIVAILIITIAILLLEHEYKIIFLFLSIDIFAVNMTAYYQYISQSTMRFSELSIRKILFAILKMALVLFMIVMNVIGLKQFVGVNIYICGLVFIDIALLIWYFVTYKELSAGKSETFLQCRKDITSFFKEGIILTIAYQAASVVFSLDSQFVSILYDTSTYGVYSFAYSLISMVTTVVSAVSFVLFPRLKRLSSENIINSFPKAMASITIMAVAAMMGYQPLCNLIEIFFPEYIDSIVYLRIIIPGLALSCCINIIMFTYYKALNKHFIYFKISCFVLLLASIFNYVAYKVFENPTYISMASIVILIVWYIMNLHYFIKKYHVYWKKNFIYIIASMAIFYVITGYVHDQLMSWLIFIIYFIVMTALMYMSLIKELIIAYIVKG